MDRSWASWRRTLPSEVGVLGLALLICGACCLLGALFPISPQAPVELATALGFTGLAVGTGFLAAGARTPRWAVHGGVVFVTLGACTLISQTATNGGLMMTAWSLAWMAVYVALFFSPRAIRLHVALMTTGLGVAVLIAGLPGTLVQFVMMAVTLWVAAIVLGSVSERLRSQADSDHLTGVLNRNGFMKAARREVAIANRTGSPFALALVDLDGFKAINDAHGHAAGDALLRELALAWEGALRPGDLIARHGGDEFVLLFPATAEEDARVALARLHSAHAARWSVGVAAWSRGEPLDGCLARADADLYEAKAARPRAVALASAD